MMGVLQSKLAIALTVLSSYLSGLVEGAVKISKKIRLEASLPPCGFLCDLVDFAIVFSCQVLDGEPSEMPLHFAHLSEVPDQFRLSGLTFLFDVIFDDLGVALDQKIAGP
jgi:hypothetical protein